jgi:hypothetical protein
MHFAAGYLRQYATCNLRWGPPRIAELCVKIPLLDEQQDNVLLPIDAKFPIEDFERLMEAAENGDAAGVEQAAQMRRGGLRGIGLVVAIKAYDHFRRLERVPVVCGNLVRRNADFRHRHTLRGAMPDANRDTVAQDQTIDHVLKQRHITRISETASTGEGWGTHETPVGN